MTSQPESTDPLFLYAGLAIEKMFDGSSKEDDRIDAANELRWMALNSNGENLQPVRDAIDFDRLKAIIPLRDTPRLGQAVRRLLSTLDGLTAPKEPDHGGILTLLNEIVTALPIRPLPEALFGIKTTPLWEYRTCINEKGQNADTPHALLALSRAADGALIKKLFMGIGVSTKEFHEKTNGKLTRCCIRIEEAELEKLTPDKAERAFEMDYALRTLDALNKSVAGMQLSAEEGSSITPQWHVHEYGKANQTAYAFLTAENDDALFVYSEALHYAGINHRFEEGTEMGCLKVSRNKFFKINAEQLERLMECCGKILDSSEMKNLAEIGKKPPSFAHPLPR